MSLPLSASSCVVVVPSGRVADPAFEDALTALRHRGYTVWRARQPAPPPGTRDRMTADALVKGFAAAVWVEPGVGFRADDVDRLRGHNFPLVCAPDPRPGGGPPTGTTVPGGGGLAEVAACGLALALVRREVFEAVRRDAATAPGLPFGGHPLAADGIFCARARAAGFKVVVDPAVRLTWAGPAADPDPGRNPLRGSATPLPPGFPTVRLFVPSYPANRASLDATLASLRASDWGEEPVVLDQPADWPVGPESGTKTYKRALEAAAADGCDFALVLEDDVRVGRHLRHNLLANPLVARDQCDYLGLFLPDLVADPWERTEAALGYRLAKPRYVGPDAVWARHRVWGTQALLYSRRLVRALLDRWDRLPGPQDARVMGTCLALRLPLWYAAPCLVEHAPAVSAFHSPAAFAPDFDPEFMLTVGTGFHPPDDVPGWLSRAEGELLWRTAAGRRVLELGTACGRSAVCLGQSAAGVVSVDVADQAEAAEWVRRFGVAGRVEFRRGDAADVCRGLAGLFDLVFIDTLHDAASVERDIAAALPLLTPGGVLAFHDYPDPGWPAVRAVVDAHAATRGWRRVAQADYLGVFRT